MKKAAERAKKRISTELPMITELRAKIALPRKDHEDEKFEKVRYMYQD